MKSILFISLFLLKFHSFLFQIVIPFTTVIDNITTETPSTFMYFYFPNKIETLIKIGTPSQEIPLRIKTFRYPLSINSVQMGQYKIIRFNESNSSSFLSLSERPTYFGEHDFTQALKSKEIIRLNNDSLILENFTFLLGVLDNQYHRESGVLGLKIPEYDWRVKDVCFVKQLKERELIKKYNFFIKYNESNYDGNLIIGGLPHEIEPEKFDKNKFDEFYAEIVSSSLGLKVKEANYGNDLIDCEFNVELAIEENLIRGTKEMKEKLTEYFFKKYIDRKICQKSIFSYLDNENNEFFYCSKKLNLSEFKNIILSIDNSELTIELTYNDLFYEYNNNYYFLMYFPTKYYSFTFFRLGKVLFKKYVLTFNHDNKMIGYYKSDNKKTKDNESISKDENKFNIKDYYFLIPWIIVIFLIIIVILLVIYIIYYKPWKNRTKRANELLDDNYSYEGINNN